MHRPQDPAEDGSYTTTTGRASDRPFGPDAALAAAIVVLVTQAAEASTAAVVSGGATAFLAVWGALFPLQRYTLHPLRKTPRFPTPPDLP